MLNFQKLLEKNRVEYVTVGPNVARGNINISCPFCGDSDPSKHLGIRVSDGVWGCWRDPAHRGRKPHRLLQRLFGWSVSRIEAEIGVDRTQDISFAETKKHSSRKSLVLPSNFRPITKSIGTLTQWNYLRYSRNYSDAEVSAIVSEYNLCATISGEWKGRVIFPVYSDDGTLVTWVGRTIGRVGVRYKAVDSSVGVPTTDVLWYGRSWEYSKILCITEGPFDAISLDWRGREFGLGATCVFGSSLSEKQERQLRRLCNGVEVIVVALDRENLAGTLTVSKQLHGLRVLPMSISAKDPGEMSLEDIRSWALEISSKVNV